MSMATWVGHTMPWHEPRSGRAKGWLGPPVAPLRLPFGLCLCYGKILASAFVSFNSENISCTTFLKPKTGRKQKLALGILLIG